MSGYTTSQSTGPASSIQGGPHQVNRSPRMILDPEVRRDPLNCDGAFQALGTVEVMQSDHALIEAIAGLS